MIIDEENIPTETRIINNSLVNNSLGDQVSPIPSVSNNIDTDDSFHSAVGDDDMELLIPNMTTPKLKENKFVHRRALGCIKNRQIETPKTDMRRKVWRNMEEERVKKGVTSGLENTPPFKDITASAPPKLCRYPKYT